MQAKPEIPSSDSAGQPLDTLMSLPQRPEPGPNLARMNRQLLRNALYRSAYALENGAVDPRTLLPAIVKQLDALPALAGAGATAQSALQAVEALSGDLDTVGALDELKVKTAADLICELSEFACPLGAWQLRDAELQSFQSGADKIRNPNAEEACEYYIDRQQRLRLALLAGPDAVVTEAVLPEIRVPRDFRLEMLRDGAFRIYDAKRGLFQRVALSANLPTSNDVRVANSAPSASVFFTPHGTTATPNLFSAELHSPAADGHFTAYSSVVALGELQDYLDNLYDVSLMVSEFADRRTEIVYPKGTLQVGGRNRQGEIELVSGGAAALRGLALRYNPDTQETRAMLAYQRPNQIQEAEIESGSIGTGRLIVRSGGQRYQVLVKFDNWSPADSLTITAVEK